MKQIRKIIGIPACVLAVLTVAWLLQAESGALGVLFGDPKLDGRDPDFQRSGDLISFTIYPEHGLPSDRWTVRIDANDRI